MLSQNLTRYVDLHRSLGFKFRIQHSLLRNFVTFADAHGTSSFASPACSIGPHERRRRLSAATASSPSDALPLAMQAEDAAP